MADWTERYRPTTLSEIRGNDSARDDLREWAETWPEHREAAILHGSPGVGKTSAAHALAADMDWETVELNASDSRTADEIDRLAGRASRNTTLGGGRQLVIVDEADNFHGNVDYGGSRAVTEVVKSADQPVVLIANDFYEMSNALRNACREIEFRDVGSRSIVPVLRDVCRKEDVEFESAALETIAERSGGDLRSAIKDLQAAVEGGDRITEDDVVTSERDRTEGVFDFLDTVIKEGDAETALTASYDVDETPDDLINWIEDNVPKDFEGAELADAFQRLARADEWLGRVRATQNYAYWRYAGDNMTAGVAAARDGRKGGWTRYGPPSYWSKLGRSRSTRDTRDAIARRVARQSDLSVGSARRYVLPYLAAMIHHCKPRELTVEVAAAYDLDAGELSFVTGSGKTTNKVQRIVEEAGERRDAAVQDHSGGAFEGAVAGTLDEDDDDDADDADDGADDESDDQLTLADAGDGGDADDETTSDDADADADADDVDPDERASEAAEDDSQAGLGEFM
jgi:replication factor C large subunit